MTKPGTTGDTGSLSSRLSLLVEIQDRISKFQSDLLEFNVSPLVQRHITTGPSFLLDDDQYHLLRARVAAKLALHPNEILMVGSAKLGFSIVEKKRYRPFGEKSDIDLAVVSSQLFDTFARETFDYWERSRNWQNHKTFVKYMFRGWIRPDFLPQALARRTQWWELFQNLTAEGTFGPFAIRAGLYKSWHYLDRYHSICIDECKRTETT